MIESAKPNIPTLTLRGKNGAINVGRETIRMLNYPTHITILHGKNMRYFAVLPCEERFVLSFATPENFLKNKNIKFTIHSKEYTHDLMKSCGLSTDRTYQFIGVHESNKNRVVFYIDDQLKDYSVNNFEPGHGKKAETKDAEV